MNALYSLFAVTVLVLFALVGVWGLGWHTLFGIIIPYAAVVVFLTGFIYRVLKWARAPVPFHIPIVCGQQKSLPWIKSNNIESPSSTAGVITRMVLEVLLFRSLFRNERAEVKKGRKAGIWRQQVPLARRSGFSLVSFNHPLPAFKIPA